MGIGITDEALSELKKLGVGDDKFLRIGIIPGGCSGMTYSAAIDDELGEKDEIIVDDKIRIVSDSGSILFLDGLHIDFSNDLIEAGFRFTNPNATKSCGCGSSFSA